MKIEIHRGQDQIGGSITAISTKTTKIIIDFSEELAPGIVLGRSKNILTDKESECGKSPIDKALSGF